MDLTNLVRESSRVSVVGEKLQGIRISSRLTNLKPAFPGGSFDIFSCVNQSPIYWWEEREAGAGVRNGVS